MIDPGIIVSCQPVKDEPFYDVNFIYRMAQAALHGGSVGLRIEGLKNLKYIKNKNLNCPIIGLIKSKNHYYQPDKIYITRTINQALNICASGADIVAIDFTLREGRSKKFYFELVKELNTQHKSVEIWADVATLDEGLNAQECGIDYVSSTLCGYTSETKNVSLPNFKLIEKFSKNISIPYFAEGGIRSKEHVELARKLGCHGVVIGTALTRPHVLTKEYVKAYEKI